DPPVTFPAEIEIRLGLPTLGLLPFLAGGNRLLGRGRHRNIQLIPDLTPKSPQLEAYRYLRTALQYSSPGERPRVLLITSSTPREGKATSTVNLAITFAGLGEKTLLIDADLKKPVVHQTMSLPRRPGLTDVLTGNEELDACLQPSKLQPN